MWRRLFSSPHLKSLSSSTFSHPHPRSTVVPLRFASLSRTVATQSAGSIKKRVEDVVPIATGHEREEIQADLEGRDILEINHPVGPFGTKETPAVVRSYFDRRIVGCPGGEGEDEHDVVWFWLEKGKPHECPVCAQYFEVDTAGWLHRTKQDKGAASLSIMQSRKSLLRAHIIALVLDAEEIVNAKRSMKHAEVVIARRAVEEGRGLVVIVNKMDLLRGKNKSLSYEKVMEVVPQEIQTVIPQVTGIPIVFISALEGRGRTDVLHQITDTYDKWCSRLSTARLNRWLQKVMSRHSWKDQAAQPKIKYFTQVKARPPTFVAFLRGKTQLSDTDIRFLTKSLKEDFDLGGTPIRIMQRFVTKKDGSGSTKSSHSAGKVAGHPAGRVSERVKSDKRGVSIE